MDKQGLICGGAFNNRHCKINNMFSVSPSDMIFYRAKFHARFHIEIVQFCKEGFAAEQDSKAYPYDYFTDV